MQDVRTSSQPQVALTAAGRIIAEERGLDVEAFLAGVELAAAYYEPRISRVKSDYLGLCDATRDLDIGIIVRSVE